MCAENYDNTQKTEAWAKLKHMIRQCISSKLNKQTLQ